MTNQLQHDSVHSRDAFFDRVLQQHARLLYRVAFSVLRHPADAEDAVADALLKLLRTGGWQGIDNERAYLARVVWRAALDRFQARTPQAEELDDALLLSDAGVTPEGVVLQSDQQRLLQALIDRLPADLQEPLLLSTVEELNSREIGAAMHLPEGTVRTRLMRARALLREQVQELEERYRSRVLAAQGSQR